MNARAQGFILLMFGAALISLGIGDGLLRFVRPYTRPYILLAGLVLVLLAAWTLLSDYRSEHQPDHGGDAPLDHAHGDDEVDAHGHSAASRATWLALAPVIAILVISPPALGSYSASHQAPPAPQTDRKESPLAGTGPVALTMFDFFQRSVGDQGRTLAGHPIRLTGFVLRTGDGVFVLTRLVITCCAADALPINVAVLTNDPLPANGAWLTITGTYAGVDAASRDVPILQASTITAIRAPANPYD